MITLGFLGVIIFSPLFICYVWSLHDYEELNPLLLGLDVAN